MATHIKTSPEIRKVVTAAINSGQWEYETGSKHNRIRHKPSGRMVTFALSSSDSHASKFLARDIRHVEAGMPGWGQKQEMNGTVSMQNARVKGSTTTRITAHGGKRHH